MTESNDLEEFSPIMYLALETLQNNLLRVAMGPKLSGELLTSVKLFYFLARVGGTSGGYRKKSKKIYQHKPVLP
jgi:hypothetical protein